ncbi:T9SS type A sorting domain-containing protein [Halosquirtibacter xylanolyticus]|uniref:T9SS type A sorting domain-containing protein n=1 Tax=Halosquirtibacter xylanolyticus TaxID=3374599 RepID=UPI003749AF0B|nr:T9SS type A sorting domain-containing protein [Prolixibacteraceae bacterium]
MRKKKYFLVCFILTMLIRSSFAQSSINSSGHKITGTTGSLNYSLGQVIYNTSVNNGSVSGGVQQAYEISVVTGHRTVNLDLLQISFYPNPVHDILQLQIDNERIGEDLSYSLFDSQGKLLKKGVVLSDKTRINMQVCRPGVYFLYVTKQNIQLKVFKILKN